MNETGRCDRHGSPPRVSIVMPFYNAANGLTSALESLQRQRETSWELIAIDDGSTDSGASIVASWAHRDARIRLSRLPHDGIVAALNRGIALARAPLLARMDADDTCHPDRLTLQCNWLDRHPETGVVSSRVAYGGQAEGYRRHVAWLNTLMDADDIATARFVDAPLAHPSALFRRALTERLGGYRHGPFPEDYELWLRWMDAGVRIEKVPRTLLTWNDSPGRLSRVDPRYAPDAFYKLKCHYLPRWPALAGAPGRPRWLWGAGRVTRRRFRDWFGRDSAFAGFIDIDPGKTNRIFDGHPVITPSALPSPAGAFVVIGVGSRGARATIAAELQARGFRPGRDYLSAA